MKKLENLKEFTIYGTGIIEVNSIGTIRVDDKNLNEKIAEVFGFDYNSYNYDHATFTGEVKLTVTPYQHEELTVIKEEGGF